jgi:carbonic anhydrase
MSNDANYQALSRRCLLGGLAAVPFLPSARAFAADPPPANAPNAIGGEVALHRLMAGNARYAANKVDPRDFNAGRAARSKVQYPIAAILGCADSRVGPEFIFDQGPGQLFVVRVAGNVLTEAGVALELRRRGGRDQVGAGRGTTAGTPAGSDQPHHPGRNGDPV